MSPYFIRQYRTETRRRRYARGRQLTQLKETNTDVKGLRFGPFVLPSAAATGHFLVSGTTGSGKSLIQRHLMSGVLAEFAEGLDSRALIFDAKSDMMPFLKHIGVKVPVYSLNPFEARQWSPTAVRWDIAADITSMARAQNLGTILIPEERSGGNRYFTDAARQVVIGIVESMIRHSPGKWTFSDLVMTSLRREHIELLLGRDAEGQAVLDSFFGDDRTAYQVFTTMVSRMAYYRPVAALWQGTSARFSVRRWLRDDSIVLLGSDATSTVALNAINEVIFKTIVEEIDVQSNSNTRRTWIWIDEARLAGPFLRNEMLPFLAVKGRSRGAALVLAFQDIDGLREAAGERIANELLAQCSNKALLRMESVESANWASRLIGQHESIERFQSQTERGGRVSVSEQRVQKDCVLPSEFFEIPVTNRENGLTGYFLSPYFGATRAALSPDLLSKVVVSEEMERLHGFIHRPESDQRLCEWVKNDKDRLELHRQFGKELGEVTEVTNSKRLRLHKRKITGNR